MSVSIFDSGKGAATADIQVNFFNGFSMFLTREDKGPPRFGPASFQYWELDWLYCPVAERLK